MTGKSEMNVTTNSSDATRVDSRRPKKAAATSGGPGLLAGGRRAAAGPRRPRTRSWGLVTLAALLVIGLGLAVAAWGMTVGERTSVLAIGQSVAKGETIERSDLVSTPVAGVSGSIPVEDIGGVVGKTAAVDLVDGQILTKAMVTSDPLPGPGQSVVGLALEPARVPSAGLDAGDQVDVIAVPPTDANPTADEEIAPVVIAEDAQVLAVSGDALGGGQVLLTIVVKDNEAIDVASYSTQNRVAVVETAPSRKGS